MANNRNLIRFDWAMKRLLRNKANYDVLEGFLSELLGYDVTIHSLGESEGNQEHENDKFNRVDIVAGTHSKEVVLIELQVNKQSDYYQRMLYGVSKAITERMNMSYTYSRVSKVFCQYRLLRPGARRRLCLSWQDRV